MFGQRTEAICFLELCYFEFGKDRWMRKYAGYLRVFYWTGILISLLASNRKFLFPIERVWIPLHFSFHIFRVVVLFKVEKLVYFLPSPSVLIISSPLYRVHWPAVLVFVQSRGCCCTSYRLLMAGSASSPPSVFFTAVRPIFVGDGHRMSLKIQHFKSCKKTKWFLD